MTTTEKRINRNHEISFIEILDGEHRHLIEAIEHGSSDPEIMKQLKEELYEKTGWTWVE